MPTPPPLHSTRLERLRFDPEGARFEMEGREVRIGEAAHPTSFAALQTFHQWALADFEARRKAEVKPGWLARLKSWVGRWFAPRDSVEGRARSRDGGSAPGRPQMDPQPVAAPIPSPQTGRAPSATNPKPAPAAAVPEMRAVFGDRDGLRVIWEVPGVTPGGKEVECRYPLDSELAGRLQQCYGHLGRLGYQVVGLDLKPMAGPVAREPAAKPAVAARPAPAPKKSAEVKPALVAVPAVADVEPRPRPPEPELNL